MRTPRLALLLLVGRHADVSAEQSDKCIVPRQPSRSLEHDGQRPHEKRQKVEEAPAKHASGTSISMLSESASSQLYHTAESAFEHPHNRKR